MPKIPKPQEIYKHFKGNLYRIVAMAQHSETSEQLVIYQALYGDYQVYARPLPMFLEKVDRSKYPNATQEYRFELCQELIQQPETETPQPETKEMQPETEKIQPETKEMQPETERLQSEMEEPQSPEAELHLDPLVLEFLDAGSYDERLNILAALHHRITDEMLNIMAMAVDIELGEGNVEERFEEFKNCLLTFEKYESNRLR